MTPTLVLVVVEVSAPDIDTRMTAHWVVGHSKRGLCGAPVMGVKPPADAHVCEACARIYKAEFAGGNG